ncbi:MAG: hypothetical protein FJ095_12480 [Deltaproteobacteria bacterium]|nr:hypothetical protein [Deltaproteobacteria bacterium]
MTRDRWLVAALVLVASTLASSALVVAFLVRIPPRYFLGQTDGLGARFTSPIGRAAYLLAKNLLGLVLLAAGVVMALPGVPGQGLLTLLVGIFLLDVPGKRRFERALLRRGHLLTTINRIRARFEQAPLVVDEPEA